MTYIVVLGLVVVVVLVVVLVALGLRAGRSSRDEDDWISEERPRGRRAPAHEDDDELDSSYGTGYETGYDRRVAGAPLSPPPPSPSAPPASGQSRPAEKMDDDDYWATITFDKPKFPWQHDTGNERPTTPDPLDEPVVPVAEQAPPAPQTAPLAAPSMAAGHQLDYPAQPGHDSRPIDPLDGSLPAPVPQSPPAIGNDPLGGRNPLIGSDPLGLPMTTRTDGHDPEATQIYSSSSSNESMASYPDSSYPDSSYGSGGTHNPTAGTYGGSSSTNGSYGNPAPNSYGNSGVPSGSASGSSTLSGSGGDTDSHRLPTVDELLQRIQADRRKTGPPTTSSSGSLGSNSGGSPLSDPLNDPLGTGSLSNTGPMNTPGPLSGAGDGGYGPGSWSAPAPAASTPPLSFSTDPLGIGSISSGGHGGGSSSHTPPGGLPVGSPPGGGGFGGSGSVPGQNYSTDGYPSTPVYGEPRRYDDPPRYDDPLGTYGLTGGRDSYGSLGPPNPAPPRPEEPGRYSDFPGSNYSGGPANDPLGTGGYGSGGSVPTYYGSPPPEPAYGPPVEPGYPPAGDPGQAYPPNAYGTPAYGSGPGSGYGHPDPAAQPQQRGGDEWDTYRDRDYRP